MTKARILFVNRFYRPDHSATAQILTDLAEALAERGWPVTIITSRMRYDDPAVRLAPRETPGGVEVIRVATTRFGRAGILGRVADYASFYLAAFGSMLRNARRGDILVAKTDPPMLSVIAGLAARLKGARLVTWLQDLYPEVAAEMGVGAMRGPAGRMLRAIRNRSLKRAVLNVAIGERMAERLRAEGIADAQIAVMPNWSDDVSIQPVARADAALRREWGVGERFVIAYSGNLGRAHEADTLVGAAKLLKDRDDLVFLMIGGGHASSQLAERVRAEGLDARFQFRPYQPRELLNQSLGVADVHWLSLRPEFEGLIVPSKFYGIASAGRPVIAVTDLDGEIARLVRAEGCGMAVVPGDAAGLAAAILALAADADSTAAMGHRARALIDREYTRAAIIARWDRMFGELAGRG